MQFARDFFCHPEGVAGAILLALMVGVPRGPCAGRGCNNHRLGWWENVQEFPNITGENHGFWLRLFSPIHWNKITTGDVATKNINQLCFKLNNIQRLKFHRWVVQGAKSWKWKLNGKSHHQLRPSWDCQVYVNECSVSGSLWFWYCFHVIPEWVNYCN